MVFGLNEELEGKYKKEGVEGKTSSYWKGIPKECVIDWTIWSCCVAIEMVGGSV